MTNQKEAWKKVIKVVLLDDEELVIEVFKNSIDWGKYGMKVVKTFLDPNEAYDYLIQNDIDIVFTDIKMPVMNGDVLIEKVGAIKPYIHFVAVSAYDDYLSVKSAFKHGAFDYILKINVDSDEMDKLLRKLQLICKERTFENIDNNIKYVLQKMKETIKSDNKFYLLVVDTDTEKGIGFLKKRLDQLKEIFTFKWIEYKNNLIILLNDGHKDCIKEFIRSFIILSSEVEPVFCGKSELCNLENITDAFSQAKKAHSIARFYEENLIDYDNHFACDENSIEIQKNKDKILGKIKNLEIDKITIVIEDLFKAFIDNKLEKRKIIECIIQIHDFVKNAFLINGILPKCDTSVSLENLLERYSTFFELKNYFLDFFKKMIENYNVYGSKDIIELVTEYIHTHFRDGLSLEDISIRFGISQSHLSRSFYKKTGVHFKEYINHVKINKAKQLLINTNRIISEIYEEVGYDNVEHFSRVFKQYVGVSPNKYRNEMKE